MHDLAASKADIVRAGTRKSWRARLSACGVVGLLALAGFTAAAAADPTPPGPSGSCYDVAGNLVRSCGFEQLDLSAWHVTASPSGSDIHTDYSGQYAHTGSAAVVFAAATGQGSGQDDQLSQPILGTHASTTYTLGYWLANNDGGENINHFSATVSNVQGGTQTFDDIHTSASFDYTYFSDTFTTNAAGDTPVISFNGSNFYGHWSLDDVSVVGPPFSACEARALGVDSDRTFSINQSNPATTPCARDAHTVASATASVVPGALGAGTLSATLTGLSSSTASGPPAAAQATVATLVLTGPGLSVRVTGLHSQASCQDGVATGSSKIATLVVNGKHITVGSAPATIKLPLGLLLNINQQVRSGSTLTQRALALTSIYNNFRHTVVAESIAGC